ncbi:hypothetical protein J8J27_34005, partial [Mycobacterium tuberculosis]|nr:hypothetical protein [Mycobacterium tuberculosis]
PMKSLDASFLAGRPRQPNREVALLAAAVLILPAVLWRPDSGVLFGLPALLIVYGLALAAARRPAV